MTYRRNYLIECDNERCDNGFAGPNAGDYDPESFPGGDDGVFAYLAEEAVGMGFLRLIHMHGEAWFCGPKCVVKWMGAQ